MYHLKNKFFIVFLLALGCKKLTKEQNFVNYYHLQNNDSIYIISCMSCGGCIEEYKRIHFSNLKKNKGILVFDSSCKNPFASKLLAYRHISIAQATLDSLFTDFGNLILISKNADNTYVMSVPFD